ncbi:MULTISPECIES: hypothetical protein [Brevibacillus]|uniref:Uncharacterized protein n=1 Tax=Brevibacillus borstelensis AK1 TaxID=1300222 RepID=M8DJ76_9BACL|nr:hypothetical protein [Brevibacillus borstelensis]EMT53487.1 hypothetical protein I532_05725 [Brevibacillus borstelensis AK1]KKX53124.1 hypothetical protein X546_21475 [Brevibacillus borstelensis cifa_chp40]MBE5397903.1 hypothetical protein [Brevibacillus borstelensis]MCC0565493.1 hypothetical protein [Brevibacillus borstelensis]MCM3469380.1 hypothetical protein [Brevibacillus borstelensis]
MLNGLQLLDMLRETENKMLHLHRAIDRVSSEPDFKETVSVLTVVVRDYQMQLDKMKHALRNIEISHQQNQNGQHENTQH